MPGHAAGVRAGAHRPAAPIFKSIAEGGRFVLGNRIMVGAMALDMFSVLLGGVVAMLPAFLHEILHHGPEGLGILRAAPALGSVCVGLWLARRRCSAMRAGCCCSRWPGSACA